MFFESYLKNIVLPQVNKISWTNLNILKFYICHLSPNPFGIDFCVWEDIRSYFILKICVVTYLAPFIEKVLIFPLICPVSLSWINFPYIYESISRLPAMLVNLSLHYSHSVLITGASKQVLYQIKRVSSLLSFF